MADHHYGRWHGSPSSERFLGVALANKEKPGLVRDAHIEYLRAGARVIITNNYCCVPSALELSEKKENASITELIDSAGRCAREAVEMFAKETSPTEKLIVAGCLPPLHESYRADLVSQDDDELRDDYGLIVKHIAPHSDVLLCETMSSTREGKFAAEAANKVGKPVWVSWTLNEDGSGNLRSGEPIEAAAAQVLKYAHVEALLVNCCNLESVLAALPRLRKIAPSGIAIGAYPNGFRTVKASGGGEDDQGGKSEYNEQLTPEAYREQTRLWIAQGATIIGGCCGVFPEHIREVANAWVSKAAGRKGKRELDGQQQSMSKNLTEIQCSDTDSAAKRNKKSSPSISRCDSPWPVNECKKVA